MSGYGQYIPPNFRYGVSPVPSKAAWTWDTTNPSNPTVIGFPPGGASQPTKSGLMPYDLQNFLGANLDFFGKATKSPIPPTTLIQWIRYAEDRVEQSCGINLCETWYAAPAATQDGEPQAAGIVPVNGNVQQLGVDYDIEEAAYDFFFERAKDEGWMFQSTRFGPIIELKTYAFIYPLLNQYFQVPPSWFTVDKISSYIRLVPSTNIMNLPLFSIMLSFMGFAQSVPGGIWMQLLVGVQPYLYQSRFAFLKELVLCEATIQALTSMQVGVNQGATTSTIHVDSLSYTTQFSDKGPYFGYITPFLRRREELMSLVNVTLGRNPAVIML